MRPYDVPLKVPMFWNRLFSTPRCLAAVVRRLEDDGDPRLRSDPVVLENVVLDEQTTGAFELEQVLDRPDVLPHGVLVEVIAADGDVGRHEVQDVRVRAAEHDVLTGGREVVVLDQVRARPIPSLDRLGIEPLGVALTDPRVSDHGAGGVEGDAAREVRAGLTVHVEMIEHQIARRDVRGHLRLARGLVPAVT
jgi:hypothetical protein